MDRDAVDVHKQANKERGQYQAILTEQAWSIKDLLYGFRGNVSCGTRWVVPNGQDCSVLRRIRFILPAHGASHIKIDNTDSIFSSGVVAQHYHSKICKFLKGKE